MMAEDGSRDWAVAGGRSPPGVAVSVEAVLGFDVIVKAEAADRNCASVASSTSFVSNSTGREAINYSL